MIHRGIRRPNPEEIIAANRRDIIKGRLELPDLFPLIPMMPCPHEPLYILPYPNTAYFYTTNTSYHTVAYFQTPTQLSGWISATIAVQITTGYGGSFKFRRGADTLWENSFTAAADESGSFFVEDCDGWISLQMKAGTSGQNAYIRLNRVFIASRPFYTIV